MSLPISQAASILGAAQAVRQVAGKLASAAGFDQVLRGVDAPESAAAAESAAVESLIEKTVAAIQDRLRQAGISANPPLQWNVSSAGRLQVAGGQERGTGGHERAAEIEAIVASDRSLTALVEQLHAVAGPLTLSIPPPPKDSGLTRSDATDTMNRPLGGYANW